MYVRQNIIQLYSSLQRNMIDSYITSDITCAMCIQYDLQMTTVHNYSNIARNMNIHSIHRAKSTCTSHNNIYNTSFKMYKLYLLYSLR